jgi:hypothetical protein
LISAASLSKKDEMKAAEKRLKGKLTRSSDYFTRS